MFSCTNSSQGWSCACTAGWFGLDCSVPLELNCTDNTDNDEGQDLRGNIFRWIYTQGRFQDFFQGVADISSGGGENLPGGGEKIACYPLSVTHFCSSTQHY